MADVLQAPACSLPNTRASSRVAKGYPIEIKWIKKKKKLLFYFNVENSDSNSNVIFKFGIES